MCPTRPLPYLATQATRPGPSPRELITRRLRKASAKLLPWPTFRGRNGRTRGMVLPTSGFPPVCLMMGCGDPANCEKNERPVHRVVLTKGFWLGQTETTQVAYEMLTGKNPSGTLYRGTGHVMGRCKDCPVTKLSWSQAREYCEATGMRLPTEAEWEYAARAGSPANTCGNLE